MKIGLLNKDADHSCNFLSSWHEDTESPMWSSWDNSLEMDQETAEQRTDIINGKYSFWQCQAMDRKPIGDGGQKKAIVESWKAGEITKEEMVSKMKEL